MAKKRKPLQCAHCGAKFPRVACAGLFCGDDCRDGYAKQMRSHREALKAAGFEQHPEVSNLWLKDGAVIAEERVKHVGMDKAIRQHASHVFGIAASKA